MWTDGGAAKITWVYKWQKLDPELQNDLLGRMTALLMETIPPWWRGLMIDYGAIGRHIDIGVGVLDPNNDYQPWDPPLEPKQMFQKLRGGMYRDNEGTWWSARLRVEPPGRFSVQYNWSVQPRFTTDVSQENFALEQERFPRAEAYMPDWYRARL